MLVKLYIFQSFETPYPSQGKHLTLDGAVSVKVYVGNLECKVTQSSTDTEILCSPPTLVQLQEHQEQTGYQVEEEEEDNGTERKKRNGVFSNKVEESKPTKFNVTVVMGNLKHSPGFLSYKVNSDAITGQVSSQHGILLEYYMHLTKVSA